MERGRFYALAATVRSLLMLLFSELRVLCDLRG